VHASPREHDDAMETRARDASSNATLSLVPLARDRVRLRSSRRRVVATLAYERRGALFATAITPACAESRTPRRARWLATLRASTAGGMLDITERARENAREDVIDTVRARSRDGDCANRAHRRSRATGATP